MAWRAELSALARRGVNIFGGGGGRRPDFREEIFGGGGNGGGGGGGGGGGEGGGGDGWAYVHLTKQRGGDVVT